MGRRLPDFHKPWISVLYLIGYYSDSCLPGLDSSFSFARSIHVLCGTIVNSSGYHMISQKILSHVLTQHIWKLLHMWPGPFPDFLGGTWGQGYWSQAFLGFPHFISLSTQTDGEGLEMRLHCVLILFMYHGLIILTILEGSWAGRTELVM